MDQETLEANAPLVEEAAPDAEVVGDSDNIEVTEADEQVVPEPPTPRIQKKRAPRPSPVVVQPPIADHQFWSDMLVTKRELDREATRSRYANLVKF